jgi:hypothetical protein
VKYLAILILAFLTACAGPPVTPVQMAVEVGTTVASPITQALLLPKRNRDVKITGTGKTKEDAKQDGFNKAVEQYAGVVIVTAKEVHNDKLVRDDVIHHSAAYVEKFKILKTENTGNKVTVYMVVTIRESKIAERVLSDNVNTEQIDGEQLSAQYDTYMKSRQTGDKLTAYLLSNYPENAFDVKAEKSRLVVDPQRTAMIEIPFEIDWNYHYLVALREGLKTISDKKMYGTVQRHLVLSGKDPKGWFPWEDDYVFDDAVRYDQIKFTLNIPMSAFVNFYNSGGDLVDSVCYRSYYPQIIVQGENRIVNGAIPQVHDVAKIIVTDHGKAKPELKDIDKIDVVIRRGSCRMYQSY